MFITEDWYALSHRRALLKAASAEGHEVHLLTRVTNHRADLEATGAQIVPIDLDRSGRALYGEMRTLGQVASALRMISPDLLHNVALKPILYGTFAGRAARVPNIVNALAGMGSLFSSGRGHSLGASGVLRWSLGRALCTHTSHVVVQNRDDAALVCNLGVSPSRLSIVRGSGVDVARFAPSPEPLAPPVVVRFLGRLLWSKGLKELHGAAKLLADDPLIRVEVFGSVDRHNPDCVAESILAAWQAEGVLHVSGFTDDPRRAISEAHIVVLPSYREGLPRVLLEAAASSRAAITTDVPGCREVVIHNRTGLLVPPRDERSLAEAISRLARDFRLRRALGHNARRYVVSELSEEIVVTETLRLYDHLSRH